MKILLLILSVIFLFFPLFTNAQIITTIAGKGTPNYSGDGGLAINAEFNYPVCVRLDSFGNMYIADVNNNAIRKIDISGTITTIVGGGANGYSGDGGLAINAKVYGPHDVAFDKAGNLYFPDEENNVIRKINTSGVISTVVGTGTAGFYGDGGLATLAELNKPYAIFIDDTGNIFISDIFNFRVRKVNTSGIITTVAGDGSSGFSGDGGPAIAAQFGPEGPHYIMVNHSGELYIADWSNHRLRKVDTFGIITTVAGNGTNIHSGDGGPATSAGVNPIGVVSDAFGNIYISGGIIRKVNAAGIITTVAGIDTPGFSGDGGLATAAKFNDPHCSYIDKNQNLYIADILNNRIRKVHLNVEVDNLEQPQNKIAIYPNPTSNQISISASTKIENIIITNTIGQVVFSQNNINSEKLQVDVKSFVAGVYFIKINDLLVQKFIKD